jgi:hypothetical protein
MYFEAGALAKFIGHANVAPLLFELNNGCVAGLPWRSFNRSLAPRTKC